MRRHLWSIVFSVSLMTFTTYVALDTFVFSQTYQADATAMNTSMFDEVASTETPPSADEDVSYESHRGGRGPSRRGSQVADTGSGSSDDVATDMPVELDGTQTYQDDNMSISLSQTTFEGTQVYVADVRVSSAAYLKTAFANDSYGRNVTQTTSEMAQAHDAILAINGDNYGSRERGFVIRNGVVYRDTSDGSDVLCTYADGTMDIVDPATVTAQELVEQGVWQAFSFGPALVDDGQVVVSQGDEVGKAMASNPRTAIGMIDANHFVLVVSDGRTSESEGLSLYELAEFMQGLGVSCAYNLDGGGSSTMVFEGQLINNPTTNGNRIKERSVNDIIYLG